LPRVKSTSIDEPPAEVMEGVMTARAPAMASVVEPVQFSFPASGTESLMVFPAKTQKIFLGGLFTGYQMIKADYIHVLVFCHVKKGITKRPKKKQIQISGFFLPSKESARLFSG
jgi:hypothetical protein